MKLIKSKTLNHFDERSSDAKIDTIIIHSNYTPAWYDSSCNPFDPNRCIKTLEEHEVSAHFLISREGDIYQLVDPVLKAFHAGESKLPGEPLNNQYLSSLNNQSIGIELIATEDSGFTTVQMDSLVELVVCISKDFPIMYILGHEHVSPGRKTDPGELFDWEMFKDSLINLSSKLAYLTFPL